ncbi:lysophospholipase [Aquiflexum sp.]|uniref:alpha/beta hydrolase n=1 Tax=Aquiflexum sp. TaxID=1872584 RepID=UPI003593E30A
MKHLETSYTTHDGIKLYLQAWMPEKSEASILIVHGLGEHSSRYAHFAKKLVNRNIAVFTFDGRGHGKSSLPKPTAYVSDYKDYLKDIDALFGKVKNFVADAPAFIFGHSMGGGMVAAYALNYQPEAKGIILSAPALKPDVNVSKLLIAGASILSNLVPNMKVLKIESEMISHDPAEVKKYKEDPLNYQESIPARTGYQILRMIKEIQSKSNQFQYPVLLLHGTGDQLTNPKGTEEFLKNIASKDATFRRYPDLYHELINEIEKEEIMEDILKWILERI